MADAAEMLDFQVIRRLRLLLKRFLEITEVNQQEHAIMLEKLKRALPTETHAFIDAVDYSDEPRRQMRRKAILDAAGDCERDILEQLKHFDVNFQFNS